MNILKTTALSALVLAATSTLAFAVERGGTQVLEEVLELLFVGFHGQIEMSPLRRAELSFFFRASSP